MSTTHVTRKPPAATGTDHKRFTTARRQLHDVGWGLVTPGVETVTRKAKAADVTITVVVVFGPEGEFKSGTVAAAQDGEDGARGVFTTDDLAVVLRWITTGAK